MFQSTHPRGVRPTYLSQSVTPSRFQSTHPRGVRPNLNLHKPIHFEFQSTHPRGVRHGHVRQRWLRLGFQSTHPRGVRLNLEVTATKKSWFQSTHPRGVRQNNKNVPLISNEFQSTHPRGVRRTGNKRRNERSRFNPRTHVGCDQFRGYSYKEIVVSIHAPTWGATSFNWSGTANKDWFQSTHPRGVRLRYLVVAEYGSSFNPRTHVGCDLNSAQTLQGQFGFNPRTHVGCDLVVLFLALNCLSFQSTHPRGVRHAGVKSSW